MNTKTDNAENRSLHSHVRRPAWTASKVEEVISALWAIAGLCAWTAGIRWLAWALLIKAALDTITAIVLAVVEIRAESGESPNDGTEVRRESQVEAANPNNQPEH